MGISPCIPSRIGRKALIPHDADVYRQRHKIENMFSRLKDWRRIATRYDRFPIQFLSASALAAIVIYWLSVPTLADLAASGTNGAFGPSWHSGFRGFQTVAAALPRKEIVITKFRNHRETWCLPGW